jgi:tripartite-type tricarboxylate transporter receptor subunit TctC
MLARLVLSGLLGATLAGAGASLAQSGNFPTRPITLIVPSGPGGPLDISARTVQPGLARTLGQPVIVDNRPGASNKIAIQGLLRAPRDGHTIAVVSPAAMSIHPLLDANAGWDPLRDFTLLLYAVDTPAIVTVHPSVPARTLAQFVAWVKSGPGQVGFGTGGNGTSTHLSTVELLNRLGIAATHVPYKGDPPAFADLLSGQIQLMMPIIGVVKPHVDSGRLIALASSGTERNELMPDVPTYRETGLAGLADYSYSVWIGFVAAAGIPASAQRALEEGLTSALRQRDVSEAFRVKGFRIVAAPSTQFSTLLRAEIERNRQTIASGGIHAD